jgi:GMP synthase-like glutamine amidotransferase
MYKIGYSPGTGTGYPFRGLLGGPDTDINLRNNPDALQDCAFIILWGGLDIHPKYYDEQKHPTSDAIFEGTRDTFEFSIATKAIDLGIPIVGVCRGAQWLSILAGGSLYQNIQHHNESSHMVKWRRNDGVGWSNGVVNSAHHQAMCLHSMPPQEVIPLAWSSSSHICEYMDGDSIGSDPTHVLEACYFPKIKGLAIQGHPEWLDSQHPFVDMSRVWFNNHILPEIQGATLQEPPLSTSIADTADFIVMMKSTAGRVPKKLVVLNNQ